MFISMNNLTTIKVDPSNKYFTTIDDKVLLKKSALDKENYDILCFVARDISKITIPN